MVLGSMRTQCCGEYSLRALSTVAVGGISGSGEGAAYVYIAGAPCSCNMHRHACCRGSVRTCSNVQEWMYWSTGNQHQIMCTSG